jgi:aryl-alcohol dehydrogenase-like predicted oxidoreductase
VEFVQLGSSDLRVTRICLGTMTFGSQCDEQTSHAILDAAASAGVNFIDTADVYPARGVPGSTEEIVGRWLGGRRDDFVVASKCGGQSGPDDAHGGCSRRHIVRAVEGSLRRLGTDRLDLYQLHRFDPDIPIEETIAALDELVRSGKVRFIGCSNWTASQLADALAVSRDDVLARFCSVQPRYNLLHRVAERELFPLCVQEGIGVISYNPLAGGLLTGKHRPQSEPAPGTRFSLSPVYRDLYWRDHEFETLQAIELLALDAEITMPALAVGWTLAQGAITSAIVGATRPEQLAASISGASAPLTTELVAELDRLSATHLDGPAL